MPAQVPQRHLVCNSTELPESYRGRHSPQTNTSNFVVFCRKQCTTVHEKTIKLSYRRFGGGGAPHVGAGSQKPLRSLHQPSPPGFQPTEAFPDNAVSFLRRSISEALSRHNRIAGVTDPEVGGALAGTRDDGEAKTCV